MRFGAVEASHIAAWLLFPYTNPFLELRSEGPVLLDIPRSVESTCAVASTRHFVIVAKARSLDVGFEVAAIVAPEDFAAVRILYHRSRAT
jgi:hypothetical protein